jgi:hypothetical protein
MRSLTLAAITAATLVGAGVAHADVIENVDLTFASGAEFIGTMDLAPDLSVIDSFSGTLYGYDPVNGGQLVGGIDPFSDAAADVPNFSATPGTDFVSIAYDNPLNFVNWIEIGYTYSASGITLYAGGVDMVAPPNGTNNVNYTDPLVGSAVTQVPEPATLGLLGLGLLGLGAARRRRTVNASNG